MSNITASGSLSGVSVSIDGTVIGLSFAEATELMGALDEALDQADAANRAQWQPKVGGLCYPWSTSDVVGYIEHISSNNVAMVYVELNDDYTTIDIDELRPVSTRARHN